MTRRGVRVLEPVRTAYGIVLAVAPAPVLDALGVRDDPVARAVTRILGARHMTQGLLSGVQPSPDVLAMGVWVDVVHALTALGLGALDGGRRRAAMVDALVAVTWAAYGYRDLGTAHVPVDRGRQRWRNQVARTVLALVPMGGALLRRGERAHAWRAVPCA